MQSSQFKIAKIIDASELANIHQACFEKAWSSNDVASYLARANCYGLAYENIGFIIFEIIGDECEVKTIAILEQHRKKKLATNLCKEVIDISHDFGVKKIFLEVSENNEAAIKLYKKLGFEEYSRRKDYYRKDEDAILMNLRIKNQEFSNS